MKEPCTNIIKENIEGEQKSKRRSERKKADN